MATPSLAMVPSGYKDGKLYSVLPNNAGGDFDVTRGSLATRVNKDGLIEPVGTLGADVVLNGDFEETGADQILNGDFSQEGSDVILNGDFATDTDWSKGSQWTISGGAASCIADGTTQLLTQESIGEIDKTFKYSIDILSSTLSGQSLKIALGNNEYTHTLSGSAETLTGYLKCTSSTATGVRLFITVGSTQTSGSLSIDNVSFVEVGQNWSLGSGWSIGEDKAIQDGANGDLQQNSLVTGENYKVTLEVLDYVQGNLVVRLGAANVIGSITANGTYTFYGVASTTLFRLRAQVGFIGSVTNIIVEEVGQEWTLTDGCSITAQGARILSDGANQHIQQLNKLVVGDTYEMEYEITESVIGGLSVTASFGSGIILKDTVGVHKFYAVATNAALTIKRNAACDVTIDNIKIKRLNGDDTPRIDYTDGGCPVLLTEPQSTNLITQSNDFSVWNLVSGSTLNSNDTVSPSGENDASKLNFDQSSAASRIETTIVAAAIGTHTFSVYAKSATGSNVDFGMEIGGAPGASEVKKTATSKWQRFEVSETTTSVGNLYPQIEAFLFNNPSIYIYGAQFEQLSYATSYIPTYGAVRTRLQDSVTGAGTSSDFNSVEGVLFAEVGALSNEVESKRISLSDGSNNNRVVITLNGPNASMLVRRNGVTEASMAHTVVITDLNKIAVKYKENDFALWVNGVEVGTDNNGLTFPANTFNQLSLADGTSGSSLFGKTSQVQVFKTALSDNELELLTTKDIDYSSYASMAAALNYNIS